MLAKHCLLWIVCSNAQCANLNTCLFETSSLASYVLHYMHHAIAAKHMLLIQVAKLNQSSKTAPQIGDVLRGCTCTNLVYPTRSLLGVQAPVRTIVMYGADNQKWPKVRTDHNNMECQSCPLLQPCVLRLIKAAISTAPHNLCLELQAMHMHSGESLP